MQEKVPYEYMHSVRIELAKLILVGTRITYQATGDAGYVCMLFLSLQSGLPDHPWVTRQIQIILHGKLMILANGSV